MAALYGEVHGEPAYVPTVICDKLAGQAIAYAILAALFQRARGGGGQAIEVPMLETTIEFNLAEHMYGSAFVPPLGKPGFTRLLTQRAQTVSHQGRLRLHPALLRPQLAGLLRLHRPHRIQGRPALSAAVRSRAEHRHPLPDGRGGSAQAHHRRVGRLLRPRQHSRACRCCRSKTCPTTRTSRRWDCSAPPSIRAKAATARVRSPVSFSARAVPHPPARAAARRAHAPSAGGSRVLRQEIDELSPATGTEPNDPKRQETTQP